ncbi:hypothetical protein BW727_100267 [Jeotgalibaca dankookensis]|uniref:BIG2 domain-containing protein n=1 Tax=Jeotgalibaca dankookensis TaxID=708126 RepID=A0A1S6IMB8_9LACT|nr:Ig-like domain-containing protein [Jeotgalibaca dankookensis]AQS52675.1 hypothetical protein BW727_100267 [Jeotgalibaca dankookensis]
MKKARLLLALLLLQNVVMPTVVSATTTIGDEEIVVEEEIDTPLLAVEELQVDKVVLKEGEEVTISLSLSGNEAVESVSLNYLTPVTQTVQAIELRLNPENNRYEFTWLMTEEFEKGTWKVQSIEIMDTEANQTIFQNSSLDAEAANGMDLSGGSFSYGQVPVLTVTEPDQTILINTVFDEMTGVSASDEIDGEITDAITVQSSTVDMTQRGVYEVVYFVENSLGMSTTATRKVEVLDPQVMGMTVIPREVTLKPNETYQLEYELDLQDAPEYTLEWSSSQPSIVSVDETGKLTALKAGQAEITVSAGGKTAQVKVSVSASLETITFKEKSLALDKGQTHKLTLVYSPEGTGTNQKAVWKSSNEKILSVSQDGTVTAIGAGKAMITTTVGDKEAKLEVEVKAPVVGDLSVAYQTHVESFGWQKKVADGQLSGTVGSAKRLEAITLELLNKNVSGSIHYQTHVQSYGWMDWSENGQMNGTEGKAKRLEAIRIRLNGEVAKKYDVYYRVHAQSFGWLDWAKNGESAGTEGLALRLEGIEVVLVEKGKAAPGKTTRNFVYSDPKVNYSTHVEKVGWQNTVSNGAMSGTSGKGLRLEGILMNVHTQSLTGSIQYRTHIEKVGWQEWKEDWQLSGTQGKALRLEAIEIQLTSEMAKFYDVYYRVHAQTYGWLGWAKNGQSAGTEGLAKRLEGIEIKLVRKGHPAPGSTQNTFVKK